MPVLKKTKDTNSNTPTADYLNVNHDISFLKLAELLPETVFVTDAKRSVVYLNEAGINSFGFSPDSTGKGFSLEMFFIPDERDRLKKSRDWKDGRVQEYTALKNDGSTFPVLLHARHMFEDSSFAGIIGWIADISDKKNMQQSLIKAEQRCRDIFQNTWEFWILCGFEGEIIESSITHSITHNENYNISESDLVGLNVMDFLNDDLKYVMQRNFAEVIKNGKSSGVEHVKLKDGMERSYEYNQVLVYDGEKPVAIRILTRDVTEEVQAKKFLEISESRYRSVFENTGLPTIILEEDLLISMINVRFEELSGYRKSEIEGKMHLSQLISKDSSQNETICFPAQNDVPSFELECRFTSRQCELFDMIMQVGNISGTLQKVVSFTDITSRKQAASFIHERTLPIRQYHWQVSGDAGHV